MTNIVPIFKTHGSLAKSIISYEDEEKISESGPVSLISIVNTYNLKRVVVMDDSFLAFPSLYSSLPSNCELIFGINFLCCRDAKDKSEASLKTEHKISNLMKNSDGYKDLLRIHNAIHTNQDNFYYQMRADLDIIKSKWTDNLLMIIPPYDNFIHKNLLFDSFCVPDFGNIKPIFTYAKMQIPWDYLLEEGIKNYATNNSCDIQEVHPVYYYKEEDVKAFYTYKLIENRSKFSEPELDFFCSNKFSWESYLGKTNAQLIQ
jgi:DNA polymerase III alpha subunit